MFHCSPLIRYLANMQRHRFRFVAIAACLFVSGASSNLSAQSCTRPASEGSTCDCNATINPGACSRCWSEAVADALGCAIGGHCTLADVYQRLNQCLDGMSATPRRRRRRLQPPGIPAGGARSSREADRIFAMRRQ
jgi:hypothetical protein